MKIHPIISYRFLAACFLTWGLTTTTHLSAQEHTRDEDEPAEHEEDEEGEERIVRLSPEIMEEFGIKLGDAGPGVLHDEVVLPGEIGYNREQIAYVTPRYAGILQNIHVRLGDLVRKGDVLATLESNETLRPFEVTAPFEGTVVDYDLTPGQTVEAGKVLFTIANLSSVWADLRIYQKDVGDVREGQRVEIERGHGAEPYSGTIAYVAPNIDEHTRTGLARVVMDNPSGQWKPGLFVKGTVTIADRPVKLLIPRTAVMTIEESTVVFVQNEEGLEPHPVKLGASDSQSFEIVRGLSAGDRIVIANAITVKAELEKGSFGEGHNH